MLDRWDRAVIDFDKIDTLIDFAEKNPELHDQKEFFYAGRGEYGLYGGDRVPCGTTACLAGLAWSFYGDPSIYLRGGGLYDPARDNDLDGARVWRWASEALGLTENQGDRLFFQCDTLDEIKAVVDDWRAVLKLTNCGCGRSHSDQ